MFLAETGLTVPLAPVDLARGEQHSDAYRAINPRRVDANTCTFAAEKNLILPPVGHTYLPQPIDSLKLIEDPFLVLIPKCRYIAVGSIDGLHDVDPIEPHPKPQSTG